MGESESSGRGRGVGIGQWLGEMEGLGGKGERG